MDTPECMQRRKLASDAVGVLDQQAFRNFEFEPMRCKAGTRERLRNDGDQIAVVELASRQVYRHGQMVRPCCRFGDGRRQDPLSDLLDQPARLGDGNELFRRELFAIGAGQSQKRLEAFALARVGAHQRLVDQFEQAVLQTASNGFLDLEAPLDPGFEFGRVFPISVPPIELGLVQSQIGMMQSRFDIGAALRASADATTGMQGDGRTFGFHRPCNCGPDALGHGNGAGGGICLTDDDELVAAKAHADVVGAEALADGLADMAQGSVAGAVSLGVVDRLEIVEVDIDDRCPIAG